MSRTENLDILHSVGKRRGVSSEMMTMLEHIMSAESGGDRFAANTKSSARGCFQFLDSTWLGTLKAHGGEFGQGKFAQSIHQVTGRDGKVYWTIDDPKLKMEALNLRYDVSVSSEVAIAFTRDNKNALEGALGRTAAAGELYLAHFLGAGGATKVLRHPNVNAPISSLLGEEVMDANESVKLIKGRTEKFFRSFTVADIQQWSATKMSQELSYEQLSENNRRASWRRRNPRALPPGQVDDYSDEVQARGDMSFAEALLQFVVSLFTGLGSMLGISNDKPSSPPPTPSRQASASTPSRRA